MVGLLKGAFVGGSAAAGLLFGLHVATFGLALAFALAAGVGAVVGLVAGKPIWREGARIEAGLKSFVGALLGAAALWGLSHWQTAMNLLTSIQKAIPVANLSTTDAAQAVPVLVLPAIAMTIAMLFELDNTPEPEGAKKRVSALPAEKRVRVAGKSTADAALAEEEAEVPRSRAKR